MKFVCEPGANYSIRPRESMVFQGDAEVLLKQLPSNFFRCCITSPPYWGLRDYGTEGQIGAEEEPSDYIGRLVTVFEQVRRVLTEDGTLWLNIGDSYTSGNRSYRAPDKKSPVRAMSYRAEAERLGWHPVATGVCPPTGRLVSPQRYHLGETELYARKR